MKTCKYVKLGKHSYKCKACGKSATKDFTALNLGCAIHLHKPGFGTYLKSSIYAFTGIKACGGCEHLSQRFDRMKPEQVLQKKDEMLRQVIQNAESQFGFSGKLIEILIKRTFIHALKFYFLQNDFEEH